MSEAETIPHSVQTVAQNGAALWLDAAYKILVEKGVDKIRIAALAEKLDTTRTSFYWYFQSREALLEALIARWQQKNTGNFIAQLEAYAESINEAIFNMFDCWLDSALFDADFDLAVRNWAAGDEALARKVEEADRARIDALIALFSRFDYPKNDAYTRAHTVYYTQIGYISMMIKDDPYERIKRMPDYARVYTGHAPTTREIERFMSRHKV